jgi:2'-5' RNA ligase
MRLFIAITFAEEIKQQLASSGQAIAALSLHASLKRQENFHLTLAFLGDALEEAQACLAIDTALNKAPVASFKLYSGKAGVFRRSGGDIHWLGLKPSPELNTLYAGLSSALAEIGFSVENRPYSPHITLAREVKGLNSVLPPPPRFIIPVNKLTLMNSEQKHGLLTYTPIYTKKIT